MSKELTPEMLDELRTQIKSYFEAYYSALRNEIAGHDALCTTHSTTRYLIILRAVEKW